MRRISQKRRIRVKPNAEGSRILTKIVRVAAERFAVAIGQLAPTWPPPGGSCPGCGEQSTLRYGWHQWRLQDLPVQGLVVTVKLRVIRWRCGNAECERRTFADPLPEIASPHARRTRRIAEIVQLLGHGVGGLPGERLMKRLGIPVSDDTILRQLKRCATAAEPRRLFALRASMTGAGAKAARTEQSSWTWNAEKFSMCCRTAQLPEELNGLAGIPRSKSSAAIAAVCTRGARERARRRRGRSLTGSISCRICARRSRPS